MTKIFNKIILLLFAIGMAVSVSASPEGEYKKLSKSWKLNADGSQEFHYNMELSIYTYTAMRSLYGESFIVYNPDYQTLKINYAYTKQKDGNIVKAPDNAFVKVLPKAAENAPAYNKLTEMVVVHTGLELGATIYFDYTLTSKPGYLPKLDIFELIQQSSPVKNYTISVTAPESEALSYNIANPDVKAKVSIENGMRTVSWNLKNVKAASRAPFGNVAAGDKQYLAVSSYKSNKDALDAICNQFNKVGDIPLSTLAESITEGKSTETEKLQAIHTFIMKHFAHSKLSLHDAGYKIRPAEDILSSAYGTKTELINLMYGLLKAVKIDAEVCASFPVKLQGTVGLSAADFFIKAKADGQTYLLSTDKASMNQAGWLAENTLVLNSNGQVAELPVVSSEVNYNISMKLNENNVISEINASVPTAMVPYNDPKASSLTAGDQNASVIQKQNFIEAKFETTSKAQELPGYLLITLPESPSSASLRSYAALNTTRDCNLFLTYAPDETYSYTIEIPAGMELSTPVATKNISNAAGDFTFSVKQNGNKVEVKRSIKIKSTIISKSSYPAFHSLIAAWVNANNTQLMIKK